jgi:hypothetical protein
MTRPRSINTTRRAGRKLLRLLLTTAFLTLSSLPAAQGDDTGASARTPDTGGRADGEQVAVRGHVFDANTGGPLQDVHVWIQGDDRSEEVTDEKGRFEIGGVVAGRHVLCLSAVSYALVRRDIDVAPGLQDDLELPMFGGAATYSETVTVVAPLRRERDIVPTSQVLSGSALQSLSGGVIEDPVRAAQALPGAVTGDDYRAEYSVRGSGPDAIGSSFEGVPTSLLFHMWHQDDGGSASMINSDTVDSITLSNGSYPQRYGNRVGAWMDITMREGSRDRTEVRGSVSMTTSSLVVGGPLGSAKKGSYLASARVNYIDKLLRALDTTSSAFRFYDTQGKLVYDLGGAHQIQVSWLGGRASLDNEHERAEADPSDDRRTVNDTALLTAALRSTFNPRWMLTQRVAGVLNSYHAEGFFGLDLLRGSRQDFSYRADLTFARSETSAIDFGGQVHRIHETRTDMDPYHETVERWRDDQYDSAGWRYGAHAMLRLGPWRSWTFNPGVRFDRFTLTEQNTLSPWISVGWEPASEWKLTAATGVYHQYPGFAQVLGPAGSPRLKAARAWHADLSVARRLGAHTRFVVAAYNREERNAVRLRNSEFQIREGRLLLVPTERQWYGNLLDGYSRGLELKLDSDNPNGLSGWLAYALSYTKYRDIDRDEEFWGNFDQRHTINVFGQYRWTPRTSVSARFRYGSNYPLVGYYDDRDGALYVGSSRNALRVPAYSRLDIRANHSFDFNKSRLTVFAEVINVLNHSNVRQDSAVFSNLRYVEEPFEELFGRVPAVGILLEF